MALAAVSSKAVVLLLLLLFIVTPIVGVCNCSMFCCVLVYVHSSFAIILMGKRKLVALLCLSSECLVVVVWLFLRVPWVCLRFVIVEFPVQTDLLFFAYEQQKLDQPALPRSLISAFVICYLKSKVTRSGIS